MWICLVESPIEMADFSTGEPLDDAHHNIIEHVTKGPTTKLFAGSATLARPVKELRFCAH
jgi:hypothetical protein